MAVAAGEDFTIAVGKHGEVFSWGDGKYGRLGIGDQSSNDIPAPDPTRITSIGKPVRQVAAGTKHTGFVTDDGDLFMCGGNLYGELGLGAGASCKTPALVERVSFAGQPVAMVACGGASTAVVTEGGGLYTFGLNSSGQLGHEHATVIKTPTQVPALLHVKIAMAAVGRQHMVALSKHGRVYTWGSGKAGQLGIGEDRNVLQPRVKPHKIDSKLFSSVEHASKHRDRVVFVAAGDAHTVAVTAQRRLYTWGDGYYGATGQGSNRNTFVPTLVGGDAFEQQQVVSAACGRSHTLVVAENGSLWTAGYNILGGLGLGDDKNKFVFHMVSTSQRFLQNSIATEMYDQAFGGKRVVAAAGGSTHSMVVTEDGKLWGFGSSARFELGHGLRYYPSETMGPFFKIPLRITNKMFRGVRIGRFLSRLFATDDLALAFAMGLNGRLGAESAVSGLNDDVMRAIVDMSNAAKPWRASDAEGLRRLLGFGV